MCEVALWRGFNHWQKNIKILAEDWKLLPVIHEWESEGGSLLQARL